jgi:Lrp/AsnC family transcriptional regulator for asnA, asnC and gidA
MDATDERILSMLIDNSRVSYVKIGRELGLTEGAVRARVNKMYRSGVIRRFTIDANLGIGAVVMISVSAKKDTSSVGEEIGRIGAEKIYEVSGSYDVVCVLKAATADALNSKLESIRQIDGVMDTVSYAILK